MAAKDARIDAYIAKAQPFAQPVMKHLRDLIHKTCPDVTETMKWSFPHFDYKGIMCSMASFKNHCVFGFWKAALMSDPKLVENAKSEVAMGHFGRMTSIKDLPSDKIIIKYIKEAMKLNETGVKIVKPVRSKEVKELIIPPYLEKALKKDKKALKTFDGFPYSHKKEYIEWLEDAKTEVTREKRLLTTMELLQEGKSRNWKYMKK